MVTLVSKSQYYAYINNIDAMLCAPVNGNLPENYVAGVSAIADDDPDFIIWCNAAIEVQREFRFRTEVDSHYLRQVEAELTGGTPDYATCMTMKEQIRIDLPYKV